MQVCHNNVPISSRTLTTLFEYASHSSIMGCMHYAPFMFINSIMVSICPHDFVRICNKVWRVKKCITSRSTSTPLTVCTLTNIQKPSCKWWDILCQVIWPLHNPLCSTPTHCLCTKLHTILLQCKTCMLPLFAPTLCPRYTILNNCQHIGHSTIFHFKTYLNQYCTNSLMDIYPRCMHKT